MHVLKTLESNPRKLFGGIPVFFLKKGDRIYYNSSHVFRRTKCMPELFNWSDATARQHKAILRICNSNGDYIRTKSTVTETLTPSTFPFFSF